MYGYIWLVLDAQDCAFAVHEDRSFAVEEAKFWGGRAISVPVDDYRVALAKERMNNVRYLPGRGEV